MDALPVVYCAVVELLTVFLFAAGAAAFGALVKGSLVLRRMSRGSGREDSAVLLKSPLVPKVSVLAAPRDVSAATRNFIRRLIGLHFSVHEVVVVLDGPTQAEMDAWTEEFHLAATFRPAVRDQAVTLPTAAIRAVYQSSEPLKLVVVEKEKGGEGDALNAAVNASSGTVLALFDPRSEFVPEALLRLIRPMLENPRTVTSVCGVAPGPVAEGLPGRYGAISVLRSWMTRCAAFSGWKMLLPVAGRAVLVRRDVVIEAGGFTAGPVELFLQLHGIARAQGNPYEVAFVAAPVSYLPGPASRAEERRNVERDQEEIGRAFALRNHYVGGAGAIGWGLHAMVAMRFWRPVAETAVYPLAVIGLVMGWVPAALAESVLLATIGTGMVVSMGAVVLWELSQYRGSDPKQLTRLFLAGIPENLGYRQMRNLWLIAAFLRGMRAGKVASSQLRPGTRGRATGAGVGTKMKADAAIKG